MNYFLELKTSLFERFESNRQVHQLTKGLSGAAEKVLARAWEESGLTDISSNHSPSLIAVGGF